MVAVKAQFAKRPRYARGASPARIRVARSVNTTQVVANWLIGREIVEEEQKGKRRAAYGDKLVESLAAKLRKDFGAGYSVQNLRYMRQFYARIRVSFPKRCLGNPRPASPGQFATRCVAHLVLMARSSQSATQCVANPGSPDSAGSVPRSKRNLAEEGSCQTCPLRFGVKGAF